MRRNELRRLFNYDDFNDLMDSALGKNTFLVDVKEEEDKYIIEAELPGFKKEDVSASLRDHYLEIVATRNSEEESKGEYLYKERSTTTMKRKIYLSDAITEKIDAKLDEGILKIVIPKQINTDNTKKIEIK